MRCTALIVLSWILVTPAWVAAQEAPPASDPTKDMQEAILEMRLIVREVTENMREKGMDAGEIRQRIQQGMDLAELQKELVAKGVMDQEMVESLRKSTRRVIASTLRQQLGVTEEEWAVLAPRMQKVLVALAGAGEAGSIGGGPMGGMLLSGLAGGDATRAMSELRTTLKDKEASDALIAEKLAAVRATREQARADLKAAREELRALLTARQEAILANLGYL